jgi:hypothetical protein
MKSWNRQKAWLSIATALLVTTGASQAWALAVNTPTEGACHTTLSKNINKHTGTIMKLVAACKMDQLFDGGPACPDAESLSDIAASETKANDAIVEDCQSVCNLSDITCIGDSFCPPNGDTTEQCTAGSGEGFDLERMGFPGPYCDLLSGDGTMSEPEDFGLCAMGLSESVADTVIDNIFGALVPTPSAEAEKCLKAVSKTLPKSVTKMAGKVAKCRDTMLTATEPVLPADACATGDPKIASFLEKTRNKLRTKIEKSCPEAVIATLSFCGAGIGGITTLEDAQDCLVGVLDESSVSTSLVRSYATTSLINAAYPSTASPACGDNQINQLPNPFAPSGEECDGTALGSCASCLPPGDVFECTCAETRRSRVFADGLAADLDNGWTGASHNSKTPNGAGFVSEVSGCDCTDFTGATCTGSTVDSVCNVTAATQPQCAHRVGEGFSCDQVGNSDGNNTPVDCSSCSAEALNAGDYCTGSARYCVGGANDADRCNGAADCPGGACNGNGRCEGGSFAGNGCVGKQQCGICTAGLVGSPCSVNAHCGGGGVCNATGTECRANSCLGGTNDDAPCDADADCPGGRCAETSDCNSRCYTDTDVDMGPCWAQSDCGVGEVCRGGCGEGQCIYTYNSAPLPLSSEGTSVCVISRFHTNVTGTRDIVDGSHAVNYELRSLVHYGGAQPNSVPCPVCGGYCATSSPPRSTDGTRCDGSCTGPELECRFGQNIGAVCTTNADCGGDLCDAIRCRFDEDCPGEATCDGAASSECEGRPCRLDLSCSHGPALGRSCRVESYTAFGTTSSDCPPNALNNQTGNGLAISWTPLTSGTVSLESPAPCNAVGFQNYDCNCVFGGGIASAPNKCGPACSNPTNPDHIGRSCANFTVCVGGTEDGVSCDEDSDCGGGGTCSENPRVCGTGNQGVCSISHCAGGESAGLVCATNAQCTDSNGIIDGVCTIDPCTVDGAPCVDGECIPDSCTTDADCEMGVTCVDVCDGGLCTPLCVERGECDGGDRDGEYCALDKDCVGGGTCLGPDPEEGACAQGTFNHCDGPGWEFQNCEPTHVGTKNGCEWALDGEGGNSNPGAGFCRADINHCFINDGLATGGGTASEAYSVAGFCIPASLSPPVNSTAGLPGPGRIRQPSTVVTNFDSLP